MQEALGNSIRAHTPCACPTHPMSFTSGSMTDLLHAPLGDRRFSDSNSIGYQTRESSRSALDAGQFMNNHDPHGQLYPTPPQHSTPLWSPFAHHKDTTSHLEAEYAQDTNTPSMAQTRSQVSTYLIALCPVQPTHSFQGKKPRHPSSHTRRHVGRSKPQVYAHILGKYQALCEPRDA